MEREYCNIGQTSEIKSLFSLFEKEEIKIDDDIRWEVIMNSMERHGLLGILFDQLKLHKNTMPLEIHKELSNKFYSNLNHNLRLWKEFLEILTIFEAKNIGILPLKGMDICTRFYPSIHSRSMVDIDILVKEQDLANIEKIFYNLGYQKELLGLKEKYWKEQQCHIAFKKCIKNLFPLFVEVHWGLDFKRGNRVILPHLWSRVKEKELGGVRIKLLSPEDALFSFALNNRRFGNILSLKHAWDVSQILRREKHFDWDYVLKETRRGKMQTAIYFTLIKVQFFTRGEMPTSSILKAFDFPKWKKKLIHRMIFNNISSHQLDTSLKSIYLKAHFLIYDNLWEPLFYIINIPYEQFCKFYSLKPYTKKADLLYKLWPMSLPIFYFLSCKNKK